MRARWLLTVLTLILNSSAICFDAQPSAIKRSTSHSRGVNSTEEGRAPGAPSFLDSEGQIRARSEEAIRAERERL